jgi:hypothetical protein
MAALPKNYSFRLFGLAPNVKWGDVTTIIVGQINPSNYAEMDNTGSSINIGVVSAQTNGPGAQSIVTVGRIQNLVFFQSGPWKATQLETDTAVSWILDVPNVIRRQAGSSKDTTASGLQTMLNNIADDGLFLDDDINIDVSGTSTEDLIIPPFIGPGGIVITGSGKNTQIAGVVSNKASNLFFINTEINKLRGSAPNTDITFDSVSVGSGGTNVSNTMHLYNDVILSGNTIVRIEGKLILEQDTINIAAINNYGTVLITEDVTTASLVGTINDYGIVINGGTIDVPETYARN